VSARARLLGASVGVAFLAFPRAAVANQPPSPHMILGEVGVPLSMLAFTALAGGYAILARQGRSLPWWSVAVLALGTCVLSGMHEGTSALITIGLALYALARAIRLATWGLAARGPAGERPSHLASARPARLLAGAAGLALSTVAFAWLNLVFLGWYPGRTDHRDTLRWLVAYESETGKKHLGPDGAPRYAALERSEDGLVIPELGGRGRVFVRGDRFVVELGPDARSWKAWYLPSRFPPFPAKLLVSLPTFFVDESGRIRALQVHEAVRCPEDAPVIETVSLNPGG
jgi:hypothetical protein